MEKLAHGYVMRRWLGSALLAMLVVVILLATMMSLIATDAVMVDETKRRPMPDPFMPERKIDTNKVKPKPDKPDEPEQPPPAMQTPKLAMDMDVKVINVAPAMSMKITIGGGTGLGATDGEYLPMVKVAPIYPRRALKKGIEGYCTIEYIVTQTGSIRDPIAVDCFPGETFISASLKAVLKFKYKPRIVDGVAIAVSGVRNKFTYRIEK